ncbi:DnaD domain protein [Clostridium botulinum]|uniref:phage replisome organizer N-terminal domain-containing protein n=1 Tax=Clostridium botulinum TaxID=1491 RepID=UPI001967A625|nr:phage replisome organizer N-terminal domain-containing protein [Clostridium botulinum]MBN1042907.1 DnaD domain protein [Clostridium botulinum]
MAEASWVKMQIEMFNDPKLKIIDSREDNNLIHYIWTRSILLAGKSNKNGYLYINDNLSYTLKTLAIEFSRSFDEVKNAFKILRKLEMIEFTEDRTFRIKNWDKYQNVEGLEKIRKQTNARVAKHRGKKKEEIKQECNDNNGDFEEKVNDSVTSIDNNDNCVKDNELNNDKENSNDNNVSEDYNDNLKSNVTCNGDDFHCNVTVTEQNKKKNKTKKKIKKERQSKENIKCISENRNAVNSDAGPNILREVCGSSSKIIELKVDDELVSKAAAIANYLDNMTGVMGKLDIGSLKLAISMHNEKYVKRAIDKAIEVGRVNMPYINGILKNWRKDGYPKDDDVGGINDGGKFNRQSIRSNKNEYSGVKPKKPRELTEEERKRAEASLL